MSDRAPVNTQSPTTEAGRALLDANAMDRCEPPCFTYVQAAPDMPSFASRIAAIEEAARAEGRQEARDAMRTRIGTADPHFPQAIRLRLYTLIDEVAALNASESPPLDPNWMALYRLANAAESLSAHAKHPDDEGHRSWFRSAIADVDREIGLARKALAAARALAAPLDVTPESISRLRALIELADRLADSVLHWQSGHVVEGKAHEYRRFRGEADPFARLQSEPASESVQPPEVATDG